MAWCLQNTSGLAPLLQGATRALPVPSLILGLPGARHSHPNHVLTSTILCIRLYSDYCSPLAHPSMP